MIVLQNGRKMDMLNASEVALLNKTNSVVYKLDRDLISGSLMS